MVGEIPDGVPKMRLSPVIGELRICRLVVDFSESVSVSDSDPSSESLPDCSPVSSN